MSKSINSTMIGAFVVFGLGLLMASVVILGSGTFFTKNIPCVAYFSGSVKGLSIGSPVRFRGAVIGKVTGIRLEMHQSSDGAPLLPVKFDLSAESINSIQGKHSSKSTVSAKKIVKELINDGVKASLAIDSIVTGYLYVDLDYHKADPLELYSTEKHELEIPTVRSPFEKIKSSFRTLPIEKLLTSAQKTLVTINKLFSSSDVSNTFSSISSILSKDIPNTLHSVEALTKQVSLTLKHFDNEFAPVMSESKNVVKDLRGTMKEVNLLIRALKNNVAEDSSPMQVQLYSTLKELETLLRGLQSLSATLQQQPESVLLGKNQEKNN